MFSSYKTHCSRAVKNSLIQLILITNNEIVTSNIKLNYSVLVYSTINCLVQLGRLHTDVIINCDPSTTFTDLF